MMSNDVARAAPRLNVDELSEILHHVPAMVALWDGDARNRFANRAYIEWFGRTPEEVRGMHIRDLLGPRIYELNRPFIEGALAGVPQLFERTLVDSSGRTRHTQARYTPRVIAGKAEGFFVLVTDITERVRAETELTHTMMEVALLRERERIAADLHDVVIQRLFGVGLELQHVMRTATAGQRTQIESVLDGLDRSVRELRETIADLNRSVNATEMRTAVRHILERSSLMLGFVPQIAYSGSLVQVDSGVYADLLAVLTEALANVARHAAAKHVDIDIAADADTVELRVVDDGKGMHDATRRSGLANMRRRAERLGGTFVCHPNAEGGTIIEWRVPRSAGLTAQ